MKQVEVRIMGQAYLLAAPEGGEQRLQQAVQRVDAAMCKIRDAGKVRARDRIAVLAALNLAFELPDRNAEAQAPQDTQVDSHANFPDGDPALLSLLERLDQALGDDGRLI